MKKQIITAAVLCTLASGAVMAQLVAEPGPWTLYVRAANLHSVDHDNTGLGLDINDKVIPDLSVRYSFNKNLATELLLTIPQKQRVRSNGTDIGSFRHLPPTLFMQYHFDYFNAYGFKPYAGAGINYTRLSSVKLPAGVSIDKNSWGPALQLGVDIPLGSNLYFNIDVKKIYLDTQVSAGGTKLGTFNVDPVLFGVGLGWRF
jgi:outer membrane protein